MEKRVFEFNNLSDLADKMEGKRKRLNLSGFSDAEWIEAAFVIPTQNGLKALFIDAYFLEYHA